MEVTKFIMALRATGAFGNIRRYQYMPYNKDQAIEIVKSIGQQMTSAFVIDDDNRFVFENLIKYFHGDMECRCIDPETRQIKPANLKKGIFIAGSCGTGKSMAMRIMSYYGRHMEANGRIYEAQIGIYDAFEQKEDRCYIFGRQVRVDQICDQFADNGKIQSFKNCHILTVDDLGAEQNETLYMGNRLNVMRQLIEYRGDNCDQITSFTSNYPMLHQVMVDRYGDRAVSRLKEMCNYYELKGKDRRS